MWLHVILWLIKIIKWHKMVYIEGILRYVPDGFFV